MESNHPHRLRDLAPTASLGFDIDQTIKSVKHCLIKECHSNDLRRSDVGSAFSLA